MKSKTKAGILAILLFVSVGVAQADQTKTDVEERLQSSAKVLEAIKNAPDKGIPDEVAKGARCVAVVPSMLKGGAFFLGGQHGRGVATCQLPNGHWSAPAFFVISGGNWGAMFGAEDVQLVLMVMTNEGMRHLLGSKFQIGATASASIGPIGRTAEAGSDWKLNTDFLTYSRSKGLFAGVDLGGSWIEPDKDSTEAMYGKDYTTRQILDGHVPPPPAAHVFLAAVRRSTPTESRRVTSTQGPAPAR